MSSNGNWNVWGSWKRIFECSFSCWDGEKEELLFLIRIDARGREVHHFTLNTDRNKRHHTRPSTT